MTWIGPRTGKKKKWPLGVWNEMIASGARPQEWSHPSSGGGTLVHLKDEHELLMVFTIVSISFIKH
jgi:hypothetical protein